jgi:hypothetical protein
MVAASAGGALSGWLTVTVKRAGAMFLGVHSAGFGWSEV